MTSLLGALLLAACGPAPQPLAPIARTPVGTDGPAAAADGDTGAGVDTGAPDTGDAVEAARPRRVLLVIADDLGVESLRAFADVDGDGVPATGRSYAPTPTIDGLCGDGVRFRSAWAHPTCSPSRAAMFTGRFGFRTGVGHAVPPGVPGLAPDEPTLPRWLAAHPELAVATASVGKWHLGTTGDVGGTRAPNAFGWDHFAGILEGTVYEYDHWNRTVDGETTWSDTYVTTAEVDDALSWLDQRNVDESWLLWLALAAPHAPYHLPPTDLHSYGEMSTDPADIEADPVPWFQASVEALDTELGRLLQGLDARGMGDVDVIFIGDNGTGPRVIPAPWQPTQAKETLFEGGVHVPLCVSGPSVVDPGRTSDALVHAVDLFATIGALEGLDPVADLPDTHTFDSRSFADVLADPAAPGARTWAYTEGFDGFIPDGLGVAVRDHDTKLVRWDSGKEAVFDLAADPLETRDLLADGELDPDLAARVEGLAAVLDALEREAIAEGDAHHSEDGHDDEDDDDDDEHGGEDP